jgi:hypothetical protein
VLLVEVPDESAVKRRLTRQRGTGRRKPRSTVDVLLPSPIVRRSSRWRVGAALACADPSVLAQLNRATGPRLLSLDLRHIVVLRQAG